MFLKGSASPSREADQAQRSGWQAVRATPLE